MLNKAHKAVADYLESERLAGRAPGATKLLTQAHIDADTDKTERFHWAWARKGMNPVITLWIEWIDIDRHGRWLTVEHIDTNHRVGGQAWGPLEQPRADRRFQILRTAYQSKTPLLAMLQTNKKTINQILANEVSAVDTRVKDSVTWHVVALDEERHTATLVRGEAPWIPEPGDVENALRRWAANRAPAPTPAPAIPTAPSEPPILFINIGWARAYQGQDPNDPIAVDNFGYFNAQGNLSSKAHEQWNFADTNGAVFGYVTRSSEIAVARLGAAPGQSSVAGVLVVFIARDPAENVLKVVGWYENATVHRKEAFSHQRGDLTVGSSITARTEDAFVLPVADRRVEIPTSKRLEGGIGQSPLWYGDAHPDKLREVRELVAHYRALRKGYPSVKPGRSPRQPDLETRLAVEKASMDMALAYFDKARDVSKECKGWDIEALDARGVIYIEVKGLSGPSVNVELTPNEYLKMGEHKDRYVLFVVTSALTQSRRGRAFRWQQDPTSGLDIWSTAQGEVIKIEPLTGARCSL